MSTTMVLNLYSNNKLSGLDYHFVSAIYYFLTCSAELYSSKLDLKINDSYWKEKCIIEIFLFNVIYKKFDGIIYSSFELCLVEG